MVWIRESIGKAPSFDPFITHIDAIEASIYSNPALCVETCKALIEGVCKTILANKGITISSDAPFNSIVQQTLMSVINTDETYNSDIADLGRRIASVSQKLAEFRNNAGFASHGMDVLNPRITETISFLASKVTDAVAGFILHCYINNRPASVDVRIHYEDCQSFNEYFDELNPIFLGEIELSATEALFKQDYQAYKETYFEYLSSLEDEITEM